MKSVGKQLQEARLARDWTPELAARETKIKVDRLKDLEADDYSHFSSPTYARGFVRTYARALGLDEYKILRQLDNRLPDDDSANIVTDGGVAYLPETALPPRAAHRDNTGLYIVAGLGAVVTLAIVFVLFEAYRVGELSTYFGNGAETAAAAPAPTNTTNTDRALPLDSNTPPPIVETTNAPTPVAVPVAPVAAAVAATTSAEANAAAPAAPRALPVDGPAPAAVAAVAEPAPVAPRALPVDPTSVASTNDTIGSDTTAAPVAPIPPRALPVNPEDAPPAAAPATPVAAANPTPAPTATPAALAPPNDSTAAAPTPIPPRALPVNPSDPDVIGTAPTVVVANGAVASPDAAANTAPINPPVNSPSVPASPPPSPPASESSKESNGGPVIMPSLPPVAPSTGASENTPMTAPAATNATPVVMPAPEASTAPAPGDGDKRLVLTASQDSFVRVTELDSPDADKPLYAAVLRSGQSVGFDGKKFSINVGIPSAVDIRLDGVNYGPHSDQDAPETFVVQSHMP